MHTRGDAGVAEVARRQHAVVTTAQLAAAGIGRRGIAHRIEHRRLTRLHRGVYLVGPIRAPLTRQMAAVLACGPAAALSHQSAAALHGIRPEWYGPVQVTVEGRGASRAGVRVHRSALPPTDVTELHGIRVTTVGRTIADLAPLLTPRELTRTIEEARIQRKLDQSSLTRAVDGARGRPGASALRAAATEADPALTRSEAERRLRELIRAAQLPRPRSNVKLGRWEVDLLWPRERLVVEVDGFAFHSSREAFERDRRKDADLQAAGYRVIRVTWRRLVDEPHGVVAVVAAALALLSPR